MKVRTKSSWDIFRCSGVPVFNICGPTSFSLLLPPQKFQKMISTRAGGLREWTHISKYESVSGWKPLKTNIYYLAMLNRAKFNHVVYYLIQVLSNTKHNLWVVAYESDQHTEVGISLTTEFFTLNSICGKRALSGLTGWTTTAPGED